MKATGGRGSLTLGSPMWVVAGVAIVTLTGPPGVESTDQASTLSWTGAPQRAKAPSRAVHVLPLRAQVWQRPRASSRTVW